MMILAMSAWGGSWPSGKAIAGSTAPEVLIFWRFSIAVICFIPVLIMIKKPLALNRSSILHIILGAVFIVFYNKFYFTGLRYGLAGAGGVVVTTLNPILTFIFAAITFKNKVQFKEIIGIILGFIGGIILIEIWKLRGDYLFTSGNLFFIIAAISWASLSVVSQHSKNSVSSIVFTFYVITMATFIDFFIALPYGILEPLKFGFIFWFNIFYLAIFALTFATTVYFIGTTNMGAHKASSFIFLVPVSAVIIAWMTLHEIPRLSTILGGIIGISAVYLINSRMKDNQIAKQQIN